MDRKHQNRQVRDFGLHQLYELDTVCIAQGNINHDQIGVEQAHLLEGKWGAVRLTANGQIRLMGDQLLEFTPKESMIIHDQYAFGRTGLGSFI